MSFADTWWYCQWCDHRYGSLPGAGFTCGCGHGGPFEPREPRRKRRIFGAHLARSRFNPERDRPKDGWILGFRQDGSFYQFLAPLDRGRREMKDVVRLVFPGGVEEVLYANL